MSEPAAAKPRGRIRFLIGSALLLLAAAGLICFDPSPGSFAVALLSSFDFSAKMSAEPFVRLAWAAAFGVLFAVGALLALGGLLAMGTRRAITRLGRALLVSAGLLGALGASTILWEFPAEEWLRPSRIRGSPSRALSAPRGGFDEGYGSGIYRGNERYGNLAGTADIMAAGVAWAAVLAGLLAAGALVAWRGLLAHGAWAAAARMERALALSAGLVGVLGAAAVVWVFSAVPELCGHIPTHLRLGIRTELHLGFALLLVAQGIFLVAGLVGFSSRPSRSGRAVLLRLAVDVARWAAVIVAWYLDGRAIESGFTKPAGGPDGIILHMAALAVKSKVAGGCLLAYSLSLVLIGLLLPGRELSPGPSQGE